MQAILSMVAAALVTVLTVAAGIGHRPMPDEWYDNTDPHNLIGLYDYMKGRTLGDDVWEVWVCDPIGPSSYSSLTRLLTYTPRMVVDWLTKRSFIVPYFRWLSDDKYELKFEIGGTVTPNLSQWAFGDYSSIHRRKIACHEAVMEAAKNSSADGALIVDTTRTFDHVGLSSVGRHFCTVDNCKPFPHKQSGRYALLDGGVWIGHYVHEIGHTISWPHSYFLSDPDERNMNEFTNRMDVMSDSDGWVGTTAINRYAAGWVDSDDVYVWELGDKNKTIWLDAIGVTGNYQMLVLRDSHTSFYFTFGARVRDGFDVHIPKEGVEWYVVDESSSADCGWKGGDWCPGGIRGVYAWGEPYSTDHVLDVDETADLPLWDGSDWSSVVVEVLERKDGSFKVRVSS